LAITSLAVPQLTLHTWAKEKKIVGGGKKNEKFRQNNRQFQFPVVVFPSAQNGNGFLLATQT